MEDDTKLARFKAIIQELQESDSKIIDKLKTITKKNADLEKEIKNINNLKYELEARLKVLESEDLEKIKHDFYKIESKLQTFESQHDDRKEKWNMLFNFAIQLIWVSMAAWLLTKLGLQAPL
jgi:chromosome segregation ATPase